MKNICQLLSPILLCFLALILTGCFGPVAPPIENTYLLSSIPSNIPKERKRYATLLIVQTTATDVFDTTKMAYTQMPYQIAYFAKNRWADTPPAMLQPLIVATLQKTHHFGGVAVSPFIGHYDYTLSTQILSLTQNFMYRQPCLEFKVRAQLTSSTSNRIIATKVFNIKVPMPQATPYGGVIAANLAVSEFLQSLATFILGVT